jgi:carbon starvation protein CstA
MISFLISLAALVLGYFSYLSIRHEGKSISEIVGIYLGRKTKITIIVFSVILFILIGTVFMSGSAGLLTNLGFTGLLAQSNFWLALILLYYFVATVVPIDKITRSIYPLFGAVL